MSRLLKCTSMFLWMVVIFSCSTTSDKANTNRETVADSPETVHGKEVFFSQCASCHMVNKELTGPALKGAEDRWPDKKLLYAFIRNSEEVVAKDKYAHELWLKYNQTTMTKHSDLTDDDIKAVLAYIKSVSE